MVTVLNVPVYRTTPTKYQREYEEGLERYMEPIRAAASAVGLPSTANSVVGPASHYETRECFPHVYNDIVGWVAFDLVCLGSRAARLETSLWFTRAQRLVRNGHRRIEFSHRLFEVSFSQLLAGYPVENLLSELRFWMKVPPLRGRYVSFDSLNLLWPAIEWGRLERRE